MPKSSNVLMWIMTLAAVAAGYWLLSISGDLAPAIVQGGWHMGGLMLAAHAGQLMQRVLNLGVPLGCLAGLLYLGLDMDGERPARPVVVVLGLMSLLPPLAWWTLNWIAGVLGVAPAPLHILWGWAAGVAMGFGAVFVWLRWAVGLRERAGSKLTRRSALERNRRTDVREIGQFLPSEIDKFNPLDFVSDKRGLFVGLSEDQQPIYIDYETWKLSHVLLSGRTRSGKGVAAQILLSQAIARGEFVVILDPKLDAWMPHVFCAAAQRAGQPYHFLDLRPGQPPQVNMFSGCDEETVENMLIAAFSLAEKGEAADFYRLSDRKAAREAARFIAQGHTAADALAMFGQNWLEQAKGFHAALEEMADLDAVNASASNGIDIAQLGNTGGVLYVAGDMGNTRVIRMQRMLLVRLMMLAKRGTAERLITVFADEFKVHISRPFMTSLGAAAGWGMHCILAFQSLQDLADVPADLDKDSVRGAVMENCAIQLSYRIKDPETAEWLAAATGTILVDDEVRKIERNLALSETVSAERTVRMAERFLIDTNMLMNLPAGCGVLSGASALPAFCYTSPVRAAKQPQAVAAVAVGDFRRRTAPVAQPSNASVAPSVVPLEEMTAPVREVFVAKPRRVLVDEDDFL